MKVKMEVFYQYCLKWILKKIKRKRKYLTKQSCGVQVNLTPKVTFSLANGAITHK
jgi:hypothetical protein